MQAWEEIRANQGSMTAGIDSTRATDSDPERIQRLSARPKTGRYRPKPVRRGYIAHANGQLRPLGIPTVEDRSVQPALRLLMGPSFEADFYPCSHGFRRNRSTQTALRDGARMFPRTTWTREGAIVGCFDNIPHGQLMKAVEQRGAEEKVRPLLRAFLAAGYWEQWRYHKTYSGTPQGGVLSPRLCTIFLHPRDEDMMKHLPANEPRSTRGQHARRNPAYRKIEAKIRRGRQKLKQTLGTARQSRIRELIE
jgi:group II intron reverse transcriptase/maturase